MAEWFTLQYLRLIANFRILTDNPTGCSAVEFLQASALTLLALLGVKLVFHMAAVRWLKSHYSLYAGAQWTDLTSSYRSLARQAGFARVPPLYRFADRRPLAFAAGVWRPAVFLAPSLASGLPQPELRAVLAHELTHIRRRDNLRSWLLEVAYALIPALVIQFFGLHFIFSAPNSGLAVCGALTGLLLVRLVLWKPLQILREQTCDDLTVDLVRDPLSLAAALVSVWRLSRAAPRARWGSKLAVAEPFLSRHSDLEVRVRRLLDYRRPRWKFQLARIFRTAAVAAIVAAAFLVIQLHVQGKQIRIENSSICIQEFKGEPAAELDGLLKQPLQGLRTVTNDGQFRSLDDCQAGSLGLPLGRCRSVAALLLPVGSRRAACD